MMPVAYRRGAILAVTLVCLLVVFTVGGLLLRAHVQQRRQIRVQERQIQAAWLADSAVSRARAQLDLSPEYTGENWPAVGETATAEIRVERVAGADQSRRIVVEARLTDVPDHPLVQRRELVYPLASSGASP